MSPEESKSIGREQFSLGFVAGILTAWGGMFLAFKAWAWAVLIIPASLAVGLYAVYRLHKDRRDSTVGGTQG